MDLDEDATYGSGSKKGNKNKGDLDSFIMEEASMGETMR